MLTSSLRGGRYAQVREMDRTGGSSGGDRDPVREARAHEPADGPVADTLRADGCPNRRGSRSRPRMPRLSFERDAVALVLQRGACILAGYRPRQSRPEPPELL